MSKCSPPVFYYHSVAPAKNDSWVLNGLTFSLQKFEDQLQYLAKNGFRSIFLDEYSDIREGKKSSQGNEICLTFDDGYLDNWVYVWPLAKKYGIRFTLFASPECLDPRSIVRPNLADVWAGTCTMNELDDRGYLTWDELRAMQESGIVDVQSHTMSHTKYITSDEVTGFYYGGPRGVYPIWNQNPGLKPVYMADPGFENRLPWGYPLFKEQSAVIAHKATINPEVFLELSALGAGYDLSEAAQRPVYEADALQVLKSHRANNTLITERELQTDYLQRLHYEVVKSKEVLEQRLEKPIHFLCWPHGDNTQEAHELARSSGYRATTSGKLTGESGKVDRIPRLGGDFDNAPWLSRQKFHFKINSHYQRQPYRAVREIYDLKNRILHRV